MSIFERHFVNSLREDCSDIELESCSYSIRRDPQGNEIRVPYGGSFHVSKKTGKGIGIRAGNTAKEDETGTMHELEPGQTLKAGSNKKAVAVCANDQVTYKNGQIKKVNRKKPKMESHKLSCLELLRRMNYLVNG